MGACLSCLGLNRGEQVSQDGDLDRILNSTQPSYGATDDDGILQPDEAELRREREALEHITSHAADHMIDVRHPGEADLVPSKHECNGHGGGSRTAVSHGAGAVEEEEEEGSEDAEEAAWLESIQSEQLDAVQVPQKGALVMDIRSLRA